MGRRRRQRFDAVRSPPERERAPAQPRLTPTPSAFVRQGAFDSVIDGVKTIYHDKVRPLEEQYMIREFHYPLLTDEDFDAKPMVLLVGSYSTGKTSFIKYLLEQVRRRPRARGRRAQLIPF